MYLEGDEPQPSTSRAHLDFVESEFLFWWKYFFNKKW